MKLQDKKSGELKYVIKVRGITLDTNNAQKLQFDKFKNLIKNFVNMPHKDFENYISFNYNRFGPTPDSSVLTKQIVKKYAPCNQKSLICSNTYVAYPFGYK